MAEDIATLGIKVVSDDIVKATKRLDKLEKQSKQSSKQNKKLGSSFGLLKGAVAGVAFGAIIKNVTGTAAAFEKMNASLVTVTGSTEKATMAMEGITAFATSTPFQVSEITDSFIKLKALGIEPTEEKLRSFGNTSSAMGKSLNQMIEAVADAATGEFERLKEFGIKSKSEGDRVAFTFNGVTTNVGKNSKEITDYLTNIGNTKFAGAMEKQMDTLDGAFSNFSDSVELATNKLAKESGFNALIKKATLGASLLIRELTGTQNIDDFKNKIDETNASLEVWNKKLEEAKKAKDEAVFGGFFTEGAIQTANTQIDMLQQRLSELKAESAAEEERSKGALDKAGALNPEETAALHAANNEKIFEAETDRLMMLVDLDEQRLTEKLEFNERMLNADMNYYDRLYSMETGSQKAALKFSESIRASDAKGALQNGALMLSNQAKTSKEAFEVQKAFALANAVVTLPSAVMKSFDAGGGYPWGLIPAGLMLAQGLQQINTIKSSSFGGGGSVAPVSGGGGGTSIAAPVASGLPAGSTALPDGSEQRPSQQVSITLNGAGYSKENVRELITSINEEIGDGATLVTA